MISSIVRGQQHNSTAMFSNQIFSKKKPKKSGHEPQPKSSRFSLFKANRTKPPAEPIPTIENAPPLQSRAEYFRLLCGRGIFSVTPRVPITSRESIEKKSEEVRAQILASQTRKVEEFITSEEESKQLLQRINDEMANGVSESRSDMFGEEDEMEVEEEDQNAGLIAARKMPLDCADVDEIRKLLQGRPNDPRLVMEKFNIDITVSKIVCLKPNTWLNDEIVNFYMCLLQERDDQLSAASNGARKRSHYFNSFFITKLLENGTYSYGNVKRWTKKFDVFALDRVFMPVNLSNTHWTLAVAYIQKKEIHYYDSMSGSGKRHLEAIRQWLVDEAREKKQMTLNPAEWKLVDREEHVPQQRNGYDCGVFSIICADYLSDSLPLEYAQEEMADNRIKIAWAIREGKLWY